MPQIRLTDRFLAKLKPSKDGYVEFWDDLVGGLHVRVGKRRKRVFGLVTRIDGKQKRYGLGVYPAVSLRDARSEARKILELTQAGIDPQRKADQERRNAKRQQLRSFEGVAEAFIRDHVRKRKAAYELERVIRSDLLPEFTG